MDSLVKASTPDTGCSTHSSVTSHDGEDEIILRDLHVLNHDVLVRHQAVDAVVAPLPPVLRRPLVQQQRGALLEGELPGRATHVVELGDGFNRLALCQDTEG